MTIFGAELLEVAPKSPIAVCVVGNHVVTVTNNSSTSGLMPNGSFSVMNAVTETAKAYTGLQTTTASWGNYGYDSLVGAGGYAWAVTMNGAAIHRIDPATGGITDFWTGQSSTTYHIAACTDYVVAICGGGSGRIIRIHIPTMTLSLGAGTGGGSSLASSASDRIYVGNGSSGSQAYSYTPSTDTITLMSGGPVAVQRGVVVGGLWWFPSWSPGNTFVSRSTTAPYAVTSYSHSLIPGGANGSGIVSHSDGRIYGLSDANNLIGFDPGTGTFDKDVLAPVRGRRYDLGSAAGKLWIPSGEPLS